MNVFDAAQDYMPSAPPRGAEDLLQTPSQSPSQRVPEISAGDLYQAEEIPEDLAMILQYFLGANRDQPAQPRNELSTFNETSQQTLPPPTRYSRPHNNMSTPKGPSVSGAFLPFTKAAREPSGPV